ncbi:hypothetical protein TSUD_196350 [Trifolium subterraneum]|nr:hypothetical protein TSUD_196350 [Trifolium subterraneum]
MIAAAKANYEAATAAENEPELAAEEEQILTIQQVVENGPQDLGDKGNNDVELKTAIKNVKKGLLNCVTGYFGEIGEVDGITNQT